MTMGLGYELYNFMFDTARIGHEKTYDMPANFHTNFKVFYIFTVVFVKNFFPNVKSCRGSFLRGKVLTRRLSMHAMLLVLGAFCWRTSPAMPCLSMHAWLLVLGAFFWRTLPAMRCLSIHAWLLFLGAFSVRILLHARPPDPSSCSSVSLYHIVSMKFLKFVTSSSNSARCSLFDVVFG